MQIVIDIPEEIYQSSKRECEENDDLIIDTFTLAIGYGTPLPKGHGRLIDADSLDIPVDICDGFEAMDYIDGADTIIEADTESEEQE